MSPIDFSIFALYIAAVLGLGLFAARRGTGTKRDYFLAGDKLPWWMIGGSIMAANISSHHFVGIMGAAYRRGFAAMTIEWNSILIGLNALLWIFLPFYLRNGFYTVPEYLNKRYGPGARTAFAALTLLMYVFVEIAAVLYLGAIAVHALIPDLSMAVTIVALATITGLYTILGGLRAVVWTEMLQLTILLLGGIALTVATLHAAGGWTAVRESSKSWQLILPRSDPDFPWTMYLGGSLATSVFYAAANQFIVQRALAARNEWHARMGIVFTDWLKFLTPLIIIVPGLLAPRLFPNLQRPDEVFPTLVKNLLPHGLVGLVMAGLIAAIMGHVSGAINSCTTIATIDFYVPWMKQRAREQYRETSVLIGVEGMLNNTALSYESRRAPSTDGPTDQQTIWFGRMTGIVVVVIAIVAAHFLSQHSDRPIFLYLLNRYGYFTPGIAAMFLLGIFWRGATHAGALTAAILTLPLSLLLEWQLPRLPFQNRTGLVFWSCMLAATIVSLVTRRKSNAELTGLIWTRDSLKLPLDQRHPRPLYQNAAFWWALVTALVLLFYIYFA